MLLEPIQRGLFSEPLGVRWLPGESFHSLASRFHVLCGHASKRRSAAVLFGNASWAAKHDFPTQLDDFVRRTEGTLGNPDSIIRDRTIAPLFLAFASETEARKLLACMTRKGAGTAWSQLGLQRSAAANGHPLKACPRCMSEDEEHFDVAYWHTEHQTPGAWICLRHLEVLRIAHDDLKTPSDWYLPRTRTLEPPSGSRSWSTEESQRIIRLADFVRGTMSLPVEGRLCEDRMRRLLRERLGDREFVTPAGVVRVHPLASAMAAFWRPLTDIDSSVLASSNPDRLARSLSKMLDRSAIKAHPVRWLALLGFCFDSWDSAMQAYNSVPVVVQKGPDAIPRAYAAAPQEQVDAFREAVQSEGSLTAAARSLGISMSVARRWCVIHDIAKSRVLSNTTGDLRERIIALYLDGMDQVGIALELGIDPTRVRYALDSSVGIELRKRQRKISELRGQHRSTLLDCKDRHPDTSRARLRLHCQAAYSWLLNNDRKWLEENAPVPAGTRRLSAKLDHHAHSQLPLFPAG